MARETLNILQWIVFAVYAFGFNLGWIYGSRKAAVSSQGITYPTLATTMLMTVVSIVFAFSGINKFHLIWITPLLFFTSSFNIVIFSIPILGSLYLSLVKAFGMTICVGIKQKIECSSEGKDPFQTNLKK